MTNLAVTIIILSLLISVGNSYVVRWQDDGREVNDAEPNIDDIASRGNVHSLRPTISEENCTEYSTVHGRILAVNTAINKKGEKINRKRQHEGNVFEEIEKNNEAHHIKLYQGDIVVDPELDELIRHHGNKSKRNAVRSRTRLWKSRIIPYKLPSYMAYINNNLQQAINEFHKHTCLRFVPYSGHRNYILFNNAYGCSSKVGKMYHKPGSQGLSLASGCEFVGTIIHELLHALGFWHEQSRWDRDKYVRVNWENIIDGAADQFAKFSWKDIDDLGKDYDFQSIMHYDRKAFTKNGLPTIQAIHDPNLEFGSTNTKLSPKDIIEINALYDCSTTQYGWSRWSAFTPCDDDCYKRRERYCYHSGNNVQACGGNTNVYGIDRQMVKCVPGECPAPIDGHWGNWLEWSTCTVTCNDGVRKRSRQCNNPVPVHGGKGCVGSGSESRICVKKRCHLDTDDTDFEGRRMGVWSNTYSDRFDWTLHTGPTPTADTGPMADHTSGNGYYLYIESSSPRKAGDNAKLVTPWMSNIPGGQCLKFYYSMFGSNVGALTVLLELKDQSSKYFIFYQERGKGKGWKAGMGNIDPPPSVKYRLTFEAKIGQGRGYSDIAIDDVYIDPGLCSCQDEYVTCAKWAASGECYANSVWMKHYCKRSCKICQSTAPAPACVDSYDVVKCPLWSSKGECTKNVVWMKANCAKSCGVCGCADSDSTQCSKWTAQGECKKNTAFMLVKCIKSCNVCGCHNNDVGCEYWSSIGECAKNPTWMKANCRRSCKSCS